METASGLHFVATGLLGRLDLRRFMRPADASARGPMHVMVSNGALNFEVYAMIEHCGFAKCFRDMRTMSAAAWKAPKCRAGVSIPLPFRPLPSEGCARTREVDQVPSQRVVVSHATPSVLR